MEHSEQADIRFSDLRINTVYSFFKRQDKELIEDTDQYRFVYDNRITGLLLYVAGYFWNDLLCSSRRMI